jgi:stage II sporulation protein D (peptidoglycan lytic transglycosylase)
MPSKPYRIIALSLVATTLLAWAVQRLLFPRGAPNNRGARRAPVIAGAGEAVPVGTAARPLDRIVIGLTRVSGSRSLAARSAVPVRLSDGETGARIGALPAGVVLTLIADPVTQRVIARSRGFERRRARLRLAPVGEGGIRLGRARYAGTLTFRVRGDRLAVTNEIDVESYLAGVVPGEVPNRFAPEAQKAMAVAARSYTLISRGKHAAEGFDLCDGTHCQMYLGILPWAPAGKQAVRETRGLVAWDGDSPIRTFYSADCGGHTANNEDVLLSDMPRQPLPYLRGVADCDGARGPDYCAASSHHQWTRVLPAAVLEAALNRRAATRIGRLTGVRFTQYDVSGRVKQARIEGVMRPAPPFALTCVGPPTPVVKSVDGWEFRRSVGWRVLKSTWVRLHHTAPDRYTFAGRGYGHGVGLCQIGANGMASAPYFRTYREILAHYYPGATVAPLVRRIGRAAPAVQITQARGASTRP